MNRKLGIGGALVTIFIVLLIIPRQARERLGKSRRTVQLSWIEMFGLALALFDFILEAGRKGGKLLLNHQGSVKEIDLNSPSTYSLSGWDWDRR